MRTHRVISLSALACFALVGFESDLFIGTTNGQTFSLIKSFTGSDGQGPRAGLTLSDSMLYGTTYSGGSSNAGTVFKVNTDGTSFAVLKNFAGPDGAVPEAGVTLSGSTLYGTTIGGGGFGYGNLFQVNTDGKGYMVLHDFGGHAGAGLEPSSDLTLSNGVLYGTTSLGGSHDLGTVFAVNTDGTGYTVVNDFLNYQWGAEPQGDLALSGNVLYGTTYGGGSSGGGSSGAGTVFKVSTNGSGSGFAVLKNFTGLDGAHPNGVTLAGDTLYGTTYDGGDSNLGTIFKVKTDATGYTLLKSFTGGDEQHPSAGVTVSGGVLYGTTYGSGVGGAVFQVNTDGTAYVVLKRFAGSDGANPRAGLTLSGSVLYGTTDSGGTSNMGTVFKLALPSTLTPIPLNAEAQGNTIILNWSNAAFALQTAPGAAGTYTNIPGATSPYTNTISDAQRYFRLIGN